MPDSKGFEELAEKLARAVPTSLRGLRGELQSNFRALLQANMERLDLVSRERFETQAALLLRTQNRLTALEKRLQVLESTPAAVAPRSRGKRAAS